MTQEKIKFIKYTTKQHQRAVRHARILLEVKEALKPVNNKLSKVRVDRLIKK